MEKLNKLGLLCVVVALFFAGCGKKKQAADEGSMKSSKKLASADTNVPLKEETENLLEDGNISDFAFVDDETDGKKGNVAPADANALLAANEGEEDDEMGGENDETDAYGFKVVHFDFNKNSIRADQRPLVAENIEVAHKAIEDGRKVVVEGHCDQVGSASYNLALSQRRAEAVKSEMIRKGVKEDSVKTVGYGYERPLVWSDASSRATLIKELAPNRRAEVLAN